MAKELWVNDNGTVKQANEIHINDGGTVKNVNEGWVNDNGTVRQFFPSDQPAGQEAVVLVISMGGFGNFTLPFQSSDPVLPWNATIDWGDGEVIENVVTYNDPRLTHSYGPGDIWEITISGSANCTRFLGSLESDKLIEVKSWGNTGWTSCEGAFTSATNCVFTAGPFSNTVNVTNMKFMFWQCWEGNPDVSGFNTSSVTNMGAMFADCFIADPDVSGFNTSSVTSMGGMFDGCLIADPDVSGFNTSNVTDMAGMFNGCLMASPNVGGFNTSNVTQMATTFRECPVDPQISGWDVSSLLNADKICELSGLTDANYDAILIAWALQPVQAFVKAGFHGAKYSVGAAASRDVLTNGNSWIVVDGGPA